MSLHTYTARDLGITGPHLIAHNLDGDRLIVDEVLGYVVDWCNVTARTKEWTAVFTYRAPGSVEPITGRVPVRRLTVAGLHCDGCPWRGCDGCRYQGGTGPSERANSLVVWDNYSSTQSVPAPALTGRGLGRTGLESDAMIVATPPVSGEQNATTGTPDGGAS
jgi:hypothetical protein